LGSRADGKKRLPVALLRRTGVNREQLMNNRRMVTLDANEAVASVAHRTNEVIVIYPITPSSPMGEWCDEWSANGRKNVWGTVPDVTEMQS